MTQAKWIFLFEAKLLKSGSHQQIRSQRWSLPCLRLGWLGPPVALTAAAGFLAARTVPGTTESLGGSLGLNSHKKYAQYNYLLVQTGFVVMLQCSLLKELRFGFVVSRDFEWNPRCVVRKPYLWSRPFFHFFPAVNWEYFDFRPSSIAIAFMCFSPIISPIISLKSRGSRSPSGPRPLFRPPRRPVARHGLFSNPAAPGTTSGRNDGVFQGDFWWNLMKSCWIVVSIL